MMERLRQVLGDYGGTFPVTLLTGKMKGAGEANSSLIDFNKKRFMYCSEPEAGAKLNTNCVKLLTGDKVKVRGLYAEREKEMAPTYKINVCCNALPNFDVYDEGIARRIKLVEYKTRFCEIPKKKNERKLRKYTKEEEEEIARGLLNLLVGKYNMLRQNGFKYDEPAAFVSMRNLYLNDNKEAIHELLEEHIEKGDAKDYVKMTDIKALLKQGGVKEKDVISIQKLVEDHFEDVEFRENSYVNNKKVRNYFLGIKLK
jgi:putative DNA primase/helicase